MKESDSYGSDLKPLEESLKGLHATFETRYDDAFIGRKQATLRQQGLCLLTLDVALQDFSVH
jgi:hypothetical protein